jgi:hypothetical protein
MKQKLLTRLILGALAGMAAGTTFAGQIQASSVSIAREVIITNAQLVKAPQVAYRFFGDVDARTQTQTFQVQLELKAGTWGAVGDRRSITLTDGIDGREIVQTPFPGAAVPGTYQVLAIARSADNKTLFATLELAQRPGAFVDVGLSGRISGLVRQPIVGFNGVENADTGRVLPFTFSQVNGLRDVVGTVTECDLTNRNLEVEVYHFKALTTPSAIATTANAQADEHTRISSTNKGTIIVFPTNVQVNVATSTGRTTVRPNGGNVLFTNGTTDLINIAGNNTFISTKQINTGYFNYSQFATGYDSDTVVVYALNDAGGAALGIDRPAAAVEPFGNVAATSGDIEARQSLVVVSASQGFAGSQANSFVTLATNPDCTGVLVGEIAGSRTADNKSTTLALDTQLLITAGHGPNGNNKVYICYAVDGATIVPQSAFSATVRLEKQADGLAAAATTRFQEQDNFCKGPLFALGGGVKIDVRNYITSKNTTGWKSYIRVINNSESLVADITAQIIHYDGSYGPWGVLSAAGLKSRESIVWSADQIDALLTNAPANAAGNSNFVGGPATVQARSFGDRLRISSLNGATLRVQNYLFNAATGQFTEASSSQGVDFQGPVNNQAPANDGQLLEQDAQQGISK